MCFSKHGDCSEIHTGELFALISVVSSLFSKCEIVYSFWERAVTLWCLRRAFIVSVQPLISCLVRDESRLSFSVVPQWHMDTVRGHAASCSWAVPLAVDLEQVKIIFSLGNTSLLDPTWSESSQAIVQQVFLGHRWGCLLDISHSPLCGLSHDRRGPYGCFQPESWVKRMWHFRVGTFSFKTLQVHNNSSSIAWIPKWLWQSELSADLK